MWTEPELFQIFDSALKDISKRVAKMEVVSCPGTASLSAQESWSLFSKTAGDYPITVVFRTNSSVLKAITYNMKRRPDDITQEEISVYTKEFFNILCGHVISAVNQATGATAFFQVPEIQRGTYSTPEDRHLELHSKYYYKCPYGLIVLEALCG